MTVLVRQFARCGIHNDLLYEADSNTNQGIYCYCFAITSIMTSIMTSVITSIITSTMASICLMFVLIGGQSSGTPSSTFIDGSTSNSNNLIRITTSSNDNVITIHLDHIGVRVYIGQFQSSNYLNVVIKFRSATSTVKQQLVLNSISSNSLCKIGCPNRESIDIKHILKATGVDIDLTNIETDNNNNDLTDYKSDPSVIDSNDESVLDQEEVEEDPCSKLYGYYRISCLYDMKIKGLKEVNNACRFAQSFDDMKFVYNSILNNVNTNDNLNDDNYVKISAKSSSNLTFNHSLNIFLVIVISFIFCRF